MAHVVRFLWVNFLVYQLLRNMFVNVGIDPIQSYQLKLNQMTTIKPRKFHYRVIDKVVCVMCDYNPATEKHCKTCGNWNQNLPKKNIKKSLVD
jgi:hypothetical protein